MIYAIRYKIDSDKYYYMGTKGWHKTSECRWRHDGVSVNNLMNIYVDDGTRDNHASDSTGSEYKITYRNVNGKIGEKRVGELQTGISTLKEAKKIATNIRRQNPDSIPSEF